MLKFKSSNFCAVLHKVGVGSQIGMQFLYMFHPCHCRPPSLATHITTNGHPEVELTNVGAELPFRGSDNIRVRDDLSIRLHDLTK